MVTVTDFSCHSYRFFLYSSAQFSFSFSYSYGELELLDSFLLFEETLKDAYNRGPSCNVNPLRVQMRPTVVLVQQGSTGTAEGYWGHDETLALIESQCLALVVVPDDFKLSVLSYQEGFDTTGTLGFTVNEASWSIQSTKLQGKLRWTFLWEWVESTSMWRIYSIQSESI